MRPHPATSSLLPPPPSLLPPPALRSWARNLTHPTAPFPTRNARVCCRRSSDNRQRPARRRFAPFSCLAGHPSHPDDSTNLARPCSVLDPQQRPWPSFPRRPRATCCLASGPRHTRASGGVLLLGHPLELPALLCACEVSPALDPAFPSRNSVMKSAIGRDLSKITMPVQFNEPLSFLQVGWAQDPTLS